MNWILEMCNTIQGSFKVHEWSFFQFFVSIPSPQEFRDFKCCRFERYSKRSEKNIEFVSKICVKIINSNRINRNIALENRQQISDFSW